MDSLADIEALVLNCRSSRARDHIREATLCYRVGAYRSAIVGTWIAVVFDLVEKLRDLALSGDNPARQIIEQYDRYIEQIDAGNEQGIKHALEFERAILDTCKEKFGFFGHQELRDLYRLREDRHQCAHPTFQRLGDPFRPTAELARLHMRSAVDHVLSQPPVQGKAAINELVAVVSSDYFPKDREAAIALLGEGPLARPSDALVRNFADTLIFGFETEQSSLFDRSQVAIALAALTEMHRALTEERIAQQLSKLASQVSDGRLHRVAFLIASSGNVPFIDAASKIRLSEFIRRGPIDEVLPVIVALSSSPEIRPAASDRIDEMSRAELGSVIDAGGQQLAKRRALVLLSETRSFDSVNLLITRILTPLYDHLTPDDIREIVRMPTTTRADLIGAGGYQALVAEVRRRALIPAPELNDLLRANRAGYLAEGDE